MITLANINLPQAIVVGAFILAIAIAISGRLTQRMMRGSFARSV